MSATIEQLIGSAREAHARQLETALTTLRTQLTREREAAETLQTTRPIEPIADHLLSRARRALDRLRLTQDCWRASLVSQNIRALTTAAFAWNGQPPGSDFSVLTLSPSANNKQLLVRAQPGCMEVIQDFDLLHLLIVATTTLVFQSEVAKLFDLDALTAQALLFRNPRAAEELAKVRDTIVRHTANVWFQEHRDDRRLQGHPIQQSNKRRIWTENNATPSADLPLFRADGTPIQLVGSKGLFSLFGPPESPALRIDTQNIRTTMSLPGALAQLYAPSPTAALAS